MECKLRVFSWI